MRCCWSWWRVVARVAKVEAQTRAAREDDVRSQCRDLQGCLIGAMPKTARGPAALSIGAKPLILRPPRRQQAARRLHRHGCQHLALLDSKAQSRPSAATINTPSSLPANASEGGHPAPPPPGGTVPSGSTIVLTNDSFLPSFCTASTHTAPGIPDRAAPVPPPGSSAYSIFPSARLISAPPFVSGPPFVYLPGRGSRCKILGALVWVSSSTRTVCSPAHRQYAIEWL